MNRVEAVCAGEVTIDLIQVDETSAAIPVLEAHVGGAPLNVAAGLARQGIDAAIWSVIGRDATGELVLGIDAGGSSCSSIYRIINGRNWSFHRVILIGEFAVIV